MSVLDVTPGVQARERLGSVPWDVRVADDLDEAFLGQMMDFLRLYMPAGADPVWSTDYFKWKLGDCNPAGRGFLTCAVAGERVVGVTSITPKRFWCRGKVVIGAEIGDTFTHPDYLKKRTAVTRDKRLRDSDLKSSDPRNADYVQHSIFGRLVTETKARALEQGIRLIYGTPNRLSRPGYEKHLNFLSHPTHHNMTFIRPTARGIAQRHWLLRRASWALSGAEGVFAALTRALTRVGVGRNYVIERLERSTTALDELWDRVKGERAFSLVRDRAYFHHRFFEHPLARYTVYTASRHGRLEGVFVTRIMVTSWGKRYCSVADWCLEGSSPGLFAVMLAHAIQEYDRRQLDGFQLWCPLQGDYPSILRWLGFVRVCESPIIFFQNEEGHEVLHGCRTLDFTLASSDNV